MSNYDPTYSPSFGAIVRGAPAEHVEHGTPEFWRPILDSAAPYMDDDIRDDLHASGLYDARPLDFLAAYMERHFQRHRSHFEWG